MSELKVGDAVCVVTESIYAVYKLVKSDPEKNGALVSKPNGVSLKVALDNLKAAPQGMVHWMNIQRGLRVKLNAQAVVSVTGLRHGVPAGVALREARGTVGNPQPSTHNLDLVEVAWDGSDFPEWISQKALEIAEDGAAK